MGLRDTQRFSPTGNAQVKRGFLSSNARFDPELAVPLNRLANVLFSLGLEVGEVVDLCRVLFDDGQHLVFTVAFELPGAVIPNIFTMEALLLLAHSDPRFQQGWMQICLVRGCLAVDGTLIGGSGPCDTQEEVSTV